MNRFWDNLPVGYWIATQFVRDNLPRFTAMTPYQPLEKALCGRSITPGLQEHIDHFAILVNSSP